MEEDNAETVWGDNSRSIRVVWPDMRSVALLSLLCSSGEILKPDWEGFCLPGFSIRCYTRGLIEGSPRRRRQTEAVKEEEPQLLFCADNQICMISGEKTFTRRCPTNSRHQIQLLEAFTVHLVFGIWMVIIQQYRLIVSSDRSSLQCINSIQPVFFFFHPAIGHSAVSLKLLTNATQTLQLFNTNIKTISRQYWQSKYFQATLAIRLVPKPAPNSFPGILLKTAGYKKNSFYHSLNTGSAL